MIQTERPDSLVVKTTREYTERYWDKLNKLSKLVSKLETVNAELEQAEKCMHGFLVYMKDMKEGLYGKDIQIQRTV